jgi:hypothetical protein
MGRGTHATFSGYRTISGTSVLPVCINRYLHCFLGRKFLAKMGFALSIDFPVPIDRRWRYLLYMKKCRSVRLLGFSAKIHPIQWDKYSKTKKTWLKRRTADQEEKYINRSYRKCAENNGILKTAKGHKPYFFGITSRLESTFSATVKQSISQ